MISVVYIWISYLIIYISQIQSTEKYSIVLCYQMNYRSWNLLNSTAIYWAAESITLCRLPHCTILESKHLMQLQQQPQESSVLHSSAAEVQPGCCTLHLLDFILLLVKLTTESTIWAVASDLQHFKQQQAVPGKMILYSQLLNFFGSGGWCVWVLLFAMKNCCKWQHVTKLPS